VKYWELVPIISAKPLGVGAASQPSILAGTQSGLLTPIAMTESGSSRARMISLTAFLELERITHELAVSALLGDDPR
jgi:hypothetical protein